ncbi:hypothetical protein NPJ88_007005 [Halomonas elongata]|uniref:hypothetical protein n=1 Tax=Halomonas elongata TaxID=2746 RepID=UPI00255B121F|nr:hypothetical protein [Halomonas elongata]MDL4862075.1 hypothetical protein [Halomonas elongata]
MSIDIDDLEALARAASKGPWHVREQGPEDFFVEAPGSPDMPYRLDVCGDDYVGHGDDKQRRHNWEFIAAADPDAVHALIARLRESKRRERDLHRKLHNGRDKYDAMVEQCQELDVRASQLAAKLREAEQREEALAERVADLEHERDGQSLEIEKLRGKLDGWRSRYRSETEERARRDARMKAEALEAEAENGDYGKFARDRLLDGAAYYRGQAQEAPCSSTSPSASPSASC